MGNLFHLRLLTAVVIVILFLPQTATENTLLRILKESLFGTNSVPFLENYHRGEIASIYKKSIWTLISFFLIQNYFAGLLDR